MVPFLDICLVSVVSTSADSTNSGFSQVMPAVTKWGRDGFLKAMLKKFYLFIFLFTNVIYKCAEMPESLQKDMHRFYTNAVNAILYETCTSLDFVIHGISFSQWILRDYCNFIFFKSLFILNFFHGSTHMCVCKKKE